MLTGDTLVFAVRSLMRLGTAAHAAYEQSVRDAPIRLDDLPVPIVDDDAALWAFFYALPRRARVEPAGDLAYLWQDERPVSDEARATLQAERLRLLSEGPPPAGSSWTEGRLAREVAALSVLRQWAPDHEPPNPATRIALALADVALDFTASNPGVLGVGGNGEKLLGALAAAMQQLLPGVDDRSDWTQRPAHYQFAERSLAILFRAGLHVVSERADLLVPERHYQELFASITRPLLDAFDGRPLDRPRLAEMRDELLGPMARAAFTTLQQNPRAFLGRRFDPNEAVGAITGAVIDVAARGTVRDVFTSDGLLKVYQATLDIAVARPALFVPGDGPQDAAVRDVLAAVAESLRRAPPPFGGALAADVAVAAIGALKGNVPGLLRLRSNWQQVPGELIEDILGGLAEGLAVHPDTSLFETLFTTDEALELVESIMREVARTPGLLGDAAARAEVKLLAGALAAALAQRGAELMRAADWIVIAEAATALAARNPLRLVVPGEAAKTRDQLLARVIGTLLDAAVQGFPATGRGTAALLFGDTLRDSILLALQAAAGRAPQARTHVKALATLVAHLEQFAALEQIGARDWLLLFERHVVPLLESGSTAGLTADLLRAELRARR